MKTSIVHLLSALGGNVRAAREPIVTANTVKGRQRPRCLAAAAALLLAAAVPNSALAGTFSDDFSGGLNTNNWSVVQSTAGLYSVNATNGEVQLAATTNVVQASGDQYVAIWLNHQVFGDVAAGDFSEQVEFTNAVEPGPGLDQVELHAYFYDNSYFFAVYDNQSAVGTNVHVYYYGSGAEHGVTAVSATAGVFRIARTGCVVTAYYNGSPFFSQTDISPLIGADFILQNNGSTDSTAVAFDNFSLTTAPPAAPNPNFSVLQTFTNSLPFGAVGSPADLVLTGNTLYGTTKYGGAAGSGAIFRVHTDGSGFTNLYSFSSDAVGYNFDGAYPVGGLVLSSNTLYGVTAEGGYVTYLGDDYNYGTIFRINTDGTGFTNLYNFAAKSDGASPTGPLVLSANILYGTTGEGGTNRTGNLFAIHTDGTGFTNLYNFGNAIGDGAGPGGLILSGNTFYGTTASGGSLLDVFLDQGPGTVFRINTDGTGFTNLFSFPVTLVTNYYTYGTNIYPYPVYLPLDGASPRRLVLSGNVLYGATSSGGDAMVVDLAGDPSQSGYGTIFRVNTDGTGFETLHVFSDCESGSPVCDLALSNNVLYGTAPSGGSEGDGSVFSLNTDGSGFTTLYRFTPGDPYYSYTNSDGAEPFSGLVLSGNILYGTTFEGGSADGGTVFSLSLALTSAPSLAISRSGANVILSWPSDATGFLLQTNGDLTTTNWSDYAGVISTNGSIESVTTVPSSGNLFFRLAKP